MTKNSPYKNIRIISAKEEKHDSVYVFTAESDPGSPILRGHFPGKPVVPGVCTLKLVKDCLCEAMGVNVRFTDIMSCKFTGMVIPGQDNKLCIDISVAAVGENDLNVSCSISDGDRTILKLRAGMKRPV